MGKGRSVPRRARWVASARRPKPFSNMARLRRSLEEIHIRSWDGYQHVLSERGLDGWAFRGQANEQWPLYSSLSRYLREFGIHPEAWVKQEERIIRIFRRKAHHFISPLPAADDGFEWLALMQHHGAPTRLLDFTWSPYVAAFFALERATSHAAVWLIHPPRVLEAADAILEKAGIATNDSRTWTPGSFERCYLPNRHRFVSVGEAFRMNRRLIAQSGTFATPGVLDAPMEEIVPRDAILKVRLDTARVRDAAMRDLYLMNMTHATLFPDLDGMARSLAYELETHWAYDPRTLKSRIDPDSH